MMRNLNHFTAAPNLQQNTDDDQRDNEQRQLLDYLETFQLDDFGKNGIKLGTGEDE